MNGKMRYLCALTMAGLFCAAGATNRSRPASACATAFSTGPCDKIAAELAGLQKQRESAIQEKQSLAKDLAAKDHESKASDAAQVKQLNAQIAKLGQQIAKVSQELDDCEYSHGGQPDLSMVVQVDGMYVKVPGLALPAIYNTNPQGVSLLFHKYDHTRVDLMGFPFWDMNDHLGQSRQGQIRPISLGAGAYNRATGTAQMPVSLRYRDAHGNGDSVATVLLSVTLTKYHVPGKPAGVDRIRTGVTGQGVFKNGDLDGQSISFSAEGTMDNTTLP